MTASTPAIAAATRQDAEFAGPKSAIPAPMSHFPSGGCTTYEPAVLNVSTMPALNPSSAPSGQVEE